MLKVGFSIFTLFERAGLTPNSLFFLAKAVTHSFRLNFKATSRKNFALYLPGDSFFGQLPPVLNIPIDSLHSSQFTIQDAGHAASLVTCIFSVFSSLVDQRGSSVTASIGQDDMLRQLENVSLLLSRLEIWYAMPTRVDRAIRIHQGMLDALGTAIDQDERDISQKTDISIFALRCAVKMLERPIENINQLVERSLASTLLSLLNVAEKLPQVEVQVAFYLRPACLQLIFDDVKWIQMHRDFKVRVKFHCRIGCSCEEERKEGRRKLNAWYLDSIVDDCTKSYKRSKNEG